MRLPNSRLADIIRQRRQGNAAGVERLLPDQSLGAGSMLSPFGPTTPSDTVTGDHYRRDFNLDVHVPQYAGLDDNERPTIDSSRQLDEDLQLPPSPQVSKSYEELRRQNREDYIRRQQAPYRPPPVLEETPQIRREAERAASLAEEQQQQRQQPSQPQMKNKYGDAWS